MIKFNAAQKEVMKKFTLEVFQQIPNIGAASGLVYLQDSIFIISDSSSYLYEFNVTEKKLDKINLQGKSQENIAKKLKPDFESITIKGNKLYVFGSGSTSNRNLRLSYHIKTKKIKVKNITNLYLQLKQKAHFSDIDLNIEGIIFYNKKSYFFQRGNGSKSTNGIFISDKEKNEIHYFPIILPKIMNVEATFTDAIVIDEYIYFLAAVENTVSTYDDGEILGCFIGCLSISNLQIVFTQQISNKHKFEGLTLFKNTNEKIELLLCEDNDTEILGTEIYKLVLLR